MTLDKPLWGLRVQKVQRVQRERFLRWMGLGHTYGVKVLRIDRPDGRRVLKFDGLSGQGLWYRPQGDEYKVSVTGFAFLCHRA